MRYIIILLIANMAMSTEGCAENTPKPRVHIPQMHWTPREWVLTLKDHTKIPESVMVFNKKDKCLKKAQSKGSDWTCVGVDPD